VGLKLWDGNMEGIEWHVFQTNPCGVEAAGAPAFELVDDAFQTNPCGVEALRGLLKCLRVEGFRRTLVGLKRRTLVEYIDVPWVSDEPLWG